MVLGKSGAGRGGGILPFLIVGMVSLVGFVALAVDLGLIAIARTQCQNAADAAAMAGARTLTGDASSNNNAGNVASKALAVTGANQVLGEPVGSSQVTVQIGTYDYNSSTQKFPTPPFTNLITVTPGSAPDTTSSSWSLCQVTVTSQVNSVFGKVFGLNGFNISTTAAAAHRPRDIAILLDFSGSMRFGSLLGVPYYGTRDNTGSGSVQKPGSNNPEAVFPLFGHYSAQSTAGLQSTASLYTFDGNEYSPANISTTTSDNRPPICADFYQDSEGTAAFTRVNGDGGDHYALTNPGDKFMKTNKNTGTGYAVTVKDLLNLGSVTSSTRDSTFEAQGYTAYGMSSQFGRYTQGPGYWGKTFFMWPPDPSNGTNTDALNNAQTNDWRKRYFYKGSGGASLTNRVDDNLLLWDSSGRWKAPGSSTYKINYDAILYWIKNYGPNPFPAQMQSGRIIYYTAIPDTIDTSTFPPADLNQRFWKDYIDFVLGLVQLSSSSWQVITGYDSSDGEVGYSGYGGDYTWGTTQIAGKAGVSGSPAPYMRYDDNPKRPRLHFWFGPMTMVDFLGCYNLWYMVSPNTSRYCWWPGICHEAPLYQCKLGIQAALTDMKNNHPNDWVSLIMFSIPMTSATDDAARFNRVRAPLGTNFQRMQDALWYPLYTIDNPDTTVNPYDYANMVDTPHAMGSTCFAYPLMLAYNQFSGNTSLKTYNPSPAPTGDAGGNGRKGAQKVIILETDGMPNYTASASFVNSGAYNSYYSVRYNSASPSSSDFPSLGASSENSSTVVGQIGSLCNQICALDTASLPGYSTARKPVLIHCIGFGPVYAPGSPDQTNALSTLQQIQYIGKTQSSPTASMAVNQPYKIIYGSQDTVIQNLQKAISIILQGGVEVSLLQ